MGDHSADDLDIPIRHLRQAFRLGAEFDDAVMQFRKCRTRPGIFYECRKELFLQYLCREGRSLTDVLGELGLNNGTIWRIRHDELPLPVEYMITYADMRSINAQAWPDPKVLMRVNARTQQFIVTRFFAHSLSLTQPSPGQWDYLTFAFLLPQQCRQMTFYDLKNCSGLPGGIEYVPRSQSITRIYQDHFGEKPCTVMFEHLARQWYFTWILLMSVLENAATRYLPPSLNEH
jgi:hypothetical protein